MLGKTAKKYGKFLKKEMGLDYLYINAFEPREFNPDKKIHIAHISFSHLVHGGIDFGCQSSLSYDSGILGIK